MNTIGSSTPLSTLVGWNRAPKAAVDPKATRQSAQTTAGQILGSFVPAGTSLYGTAPATENSLLGNISTSAGLVTLSQINAGRSASQQISPLGTGMQAAAFGASAQASAKSTLLAGALGSVGDWQGLPSAYYAQMYLASA